MLERQPVPLEPASRIASSVITLRSKRGEDAVRLAVVVNT